MSRKKKIKIIVKYDKNTKNMFFASVITTIFAFLGSYSFFTGNYLFDKILGLALILISPLLFLILLIDSREFYVEKNRNRGVEK